MSVSASRADELKSKVRDCETQSPTPETGALPKTLWLRSITSSYLRPRLRIRRRQRHRCHVLAVPRLPGGRRAEVRVADPVHLGDRQPALKLVCKARR